jgi:hypothetical protein
MSAHEVVLQIQDMKDEFQTKPLCRNVSVDDRDKSAVECIGHLFAERLTSGTGLVTGLRRDFVSLTF